MTEISPQMLTERAAAVNLLCSLDVSGRGGNVFFLSIFDRHPAFAGCALVQYAYSYIQAQFGEEQIIDAAAAHTFVTCKAYTRLLYQEPEGDIGEMIVRLGGDLEVPFDRARFRELVDTFFGSRQSISRRELVAVPLLAYAVALGREIGAVKYVIVGDAISTRNEHVVTGFSGRIVDTVLADFPQARLVRLVRDPRATFASPRHQFVNAFGNMYAIAPGQYFSRLRDLLRYNLTSENGAVYLYWLLYIKQAEIAARRKLYQNSAHFLTVINEELNTNFPVAMAKIVSWLDVSFEPDWRNNAFVPTLMGTPWRGTGAYNSRYQRAVHGPLANDADAIASKVTGPNEYVTRRWRTRLNRREIELIERLFRREIDEYGYERLHDSAERGDLTSLLRTALLPFVGEMPTLGWLRTGWFLGPHEFFSRIFYAMTFAPFYVISRVHLFDFVLRRRLFSAGAD